MKKILIVNASKRRTGNSYTLSKRFAEQLEGKAEVTIFNLGEKDVRACLACDGCKRQHTPNCVQKDDFTALIPEIDSCDAMLILAPVHWDQFPAQLKAFLDRTYSFMDFTQPDFSIPRKRKARTSREPPSASPARSWTLSMMSKRTGRPKTGTSSSTLP